MTRHINGKPFPLSAMTHDAQPETHDHPIDDTARFAKGTLIAIFLSAIAFLALAAFGYACYESGYENAMDEVQQQKEHGL